MGYSDVKKNVDNKNPTRILLVDKIFRILSLSNHYYIVLIIIILSRYLSISYNNNNNV